MKTILFLISFTVLASLSKAQTYTMDWATAFSPAWATGQTSGVANNIGGSMVKCTITLTKSGGVYTTTLGPLGGPATPTVAAATYIVAGSPSNLQIALDYATNANYTDITFAFDKPVFAVKFNLADIDRLTNTAYNYLDRVTVTGLNALVPVNPTLSKYDPTTDPNFIIISGNVCHVNATNGMAGNTASDATDQKGTIIVDFGAVFITSFTIRYDNYTGTQADPTVQNISIGDISFMKTNPLPVTLLSFDGKANEDGSVKLSWTCANEMDFDYYGIERSEDGFSFKEIGRVAAKANPGVLWYQYNDPNTTAPKYFYRLKMVDLDRTYTYSKVVIINTKRLSGFKAYPALFHQDITVAVRADRSEQLHISVINVTGQQVYRQTCLSVAGTNEFRLKLPDQIPAGEYFLRLEEQGRTMKIVKQ